MKKQILSVKLFLHFTHCPALGHRVQGIQEGKLNRDGHYHIERYKTEILHTFKEESIWIRVLTISLTVRSIYNSSTVTSYNFCFLFADTLYEATSN